MSEIVCLAEFVRSFDVDIGGKSVKKMECRFVDDVDGDEVVLQSAVYSDMPNNRISRDDLVMMLKGMLRGLNKE